MNLVILGPQGSGKGTQAELLMHKFDLNRFEAGKIFRNIADSDKPYAAEVKAAIDQGQLAPDKYTQAITEEFLEKHQNGKGFIFDGNPRTLEQYKWFKEMMAKYQQKIDWIINIEISEAETIKRLSARRTCAKCGEVYNLITNPPQGTACDKCGGVLEQREDDKPEAIKSRLNIYRTQTHPVFEQALAEGIGFEVNGEQPIAAIQEQILAHIHD